MSEEQPAKVPDRDACLVPLGPGMVPRKWQEECMLAIREGLKVNQTVLVSAATGTGKGSMIASMAVKVVMSGKRLLFLVHRDELIDDVMGRAKQYYPAMDAGKVRGTINEVDKQAVFASVQSLHKNRLPSLGHFDFVITDEAHHATAKSYLNVYKRVEEVNPKWKHIGFTATPFRSAGEGKTEGLGKAFKKLVYEYGILKAIEDKALCPLRGIAVETELDLSEVDPEDEEALEKIIDTPTRNRIVADKYLELLAGKQAICFGVTVAHAKNLATAMTEAGIKAEAVWGGDKQRNQKIARYKAGETKVLTNCGLLTEGFDAPQTEAVILVRPTGSIGLYSQMVGRATRLHPGKEEGLIVDFVGNTEKYKIVSLADLSTPKDQARILKGDEVRYRRNPLLPVTVVLEVKGFVDRQEEGDARIEMAAGWERVARDGWVRTADLVLAVNQEAGTEPGDIEFPVAIGANHFPVSLFGKSQTLWYCYESSGKKTFIAKGRGKVALIRKPEEKWEAWLREQEAENQWSTPELVKEGTFQECSAAVNVQTDVDKAWMEQPATDGQMAALKRFKVRRQGLTRGEASQILEMKIFQAEIEKTGKSKYFAIEPTIRQAVKECDVAFDGVVGAYGVLNKASVILWNQDVKKFFDYFKTNSVSEKQRDEILPVIESIMESSEEFYRTNKYQWERRRWTSEWILRILKNQQDGRASTGFILKATRADTWIDGRQKLTEFLRSMAEKSEIVEDDEEWYLRFFEQTTETK